jgi:two-component system chemotaxis response regulator CheY
MLEGCRLRHRDGFNRVLPMSYNFLVVDDSITMRALVKRTIRSAGLAAEVFYDAADSEEALEILDRCKVDLILADLNLPEMDGAELIERLLAEPDTRAIPVVILADHPDMRTVQRLRSAGARGFLRKPFTVEALRDVVAGILEPTHV